MEKDKVIPKRHNNVVSRNNIDSTIAIMRLDEDQNFFTLDAIAAETWNLIDGKTSVDRIVKKLAKKHSLAEKRLSSDIQNLMNQLKKERLIELLS